MPTTKDQKLIKIPLLTIASLHERKMTDSDSGNALINFAIKDHIIKIQGENIAELTRKLEEL